MTNRHAWYAGLSFLFLCRCTYFQAELTLHTCSLYPYCPALALLTYILQYFAHSELILHDIGA